TQVLDTRSYPIHIAQLNVIEIGKPDFATYPLHSNCQCHTLSNRQSDNADLLRSQRINFVKVDFIRIAIGTHFYKVDFIQHVHTIAIPRKIYPHTVSVNWAPRHPLIEKPTALRSVQCLTWERNTHQFFQLLLDRIIPLYFTRSEERRVGKECRS